MSATVARNGGDHCEAVLLGAIGRYDIKKFLVAASASRFGVISDEERTGIFRDAQNNQKIRDDFQSLIVGKGRLKSLAAFILDYNSHVQEAAQEVLKRLTLTSAGIESEVCPLKNRNRGSSFSSSSGTPPSPMDIDYQVSLRNVIIILQSCALGSYCIIMMSVIEHTLSLHDLSAKLSFSSGFDSIHSYFICVIATLN